MTAYAGGVYGEVTTLELPASGPAAVNHSTAKMPIGAKFRWNGAVYRYVKHSTGTGAIAAVIGAAAYPKALTPAASATAVPVFTVTPDASDSVLGKLPVGVYLGVPTDTYFCCIQIGGKATCKIPGAVEGDVLVGGTADAAFEKISEGSNLTQIPVGKVMEGASSSSLSSAMLMNMDW